LRIVDLPHSNPSNFSDADANPENAAKEARLQMRDNDAARMQQKCNTSVSKAQA
jgi:hypothetical protein